MWKPFESIFCISILYRLSSVLIIQTSYVPDEYWQSLEVAHKMVFGYGHLTWEWKQGVRSSIYPSAFALLYKFMEYLGIDAPRLVILMPRFLQALLTGVSDYYFLMWCKDFKFDMYWAKMIMFTNWFWFYCGSRTLINTFETCLTTIALYYYPWSFLIAEKKEYKRIQVLSPEVKSRSLKYLFVAAFNCVVRPTALTTWAPFVAFQLSFMHLRLMRYFIIHCVLPVVFTVLPISFAFDYLWYGKFVFPAWNFFFFNISGGIGSFYGTHPFHWYMVQGLPVVLGLHYVLFSVGITSFLYELFTEPVNRFKNVFKIITLTFLINLFVLSSIQHKEFRFMLPLTPLMMIIIVKVSSEMLYCVRRTYKLLWSLSLIMGFLIPTFLFGSIHQKGIINLTDYLRQSVPSCHDKCSFLFLMPCHSTPLYSHLHTNVSTRFLACEPPIMGNHYDESEVFFKDPYLWLDRNWASIKYPTHVALFDNVERSVRSYLNVKGFVRKKRFLNTIFAKQNHGRIIFVYQPTHSVKNVT